MVYMGVTVRTAPDRGAAYAGSMRVYKAMLLPPDLVGKMPCQYCGEPSEAIFGFIEKLPGKVQKPQVRVCLRDAQRLCARFNIALENPPQEASDEHATGAAGGGPTG
jgi:hypothetical protein